MSIKVTSPSPVRNKQDTTQNIDTETITIELQGPVIQCNVATVSLPRLRPRPRLDSEGGSVADISELNNVI